MAQPKLRLRSNTFLRKQQKCHDTENLDLTSDIICATSKRDVVQRINTRETKKKKRTVPEELHCKKNTADVIPASTQPEILLRRSSRARKSKNQLASESFDINSVDIQEQQHILKELRPSAIKSKSRSSSKKKTKKKCPSSQKRAITPVAVKMLKLNKRLELLKETETENLTRMDISMRLLRETGVGKTLSALIKSVKKGSQICQLATSLRRLWRYRLLKPDDCRKRMEENKQEKVGRKRKRVTTSTDSSTIFEIRQKMQIQLRKNCRFESSPLLLSKESDGRIIVAGYKDRRELGVFTNIMKGDVILKVGSLVVNPNTKCGEVDSHIKELVTNAGFGLRTLQYSRGKHVKIKKLFTIRGKAIDPKELYEVIETFGGLEEVKQKKMMSKVTKTLGLEPSTCGSFRLKKAYESYFPELL